MKGNYYTTHPGLPLGEFLRGRRLGAVGIGGDGDGGHLLCARHADHGHDPCHAHRGHGRDRCPLPHPAAVPHHHRLRYGPEPRGRQAHGRECHGPAAQAAEPERERPHGGGSARGCAGAAHCRTHRAHGRAAAVLTAGGDREERGVARCCGPGVYTGALYMAVRASVRASRIWFFAWRAA
jgi:hypothetical protein